MKVKILDPRVRLPKDPKAKKGSVKKGSIVDVSKDVANRLVGFGRAEFVNAKDKPSGPVDRPDSD